MWWDWGLNSVLAKEMLYLLNPISSSFCSGYFGDEIS
jgi:hypothetical protein